MPSISWSDIDTNKYTIGYLDSTEVKSAKEKGIDNVFVGMIQEDYESEIDVDMVIKKYDKGAYGRIPMNIISEKRKVIADKYREIMVLDYKYNNLSSEMKEKFNFIDNFKDFIYKNFKIGSANKEYTEYKSKLQNLILEKANKEEELSAYIDKVLYKRAQINTNKNLQFAYCSNYQR